MVKIFLFFSEFGGEYLREWSIRRSYLVKKNLDADFAENLAD